MKQQTTKIILALTLIGLSAGSANAQTWNNRYNNSIDTIPHRIYWDIAEQPEIMALAGFRGDSAISHSFNLGELADITWGQGDITSWGAASTVQVH